MNEMEGQWCKFNKRIKMFQWRTEKTEWTFNHNTIFNTITNIEKKDGDTYVYKKIIIQ